MEKKVIRAALLGFGTVGTGVYKVLEKQKEEMIPKLGSQLEISKILVRNLQKAASKVKNPEILTNNWDEIVKDPEIDIVIELIGGIEPARTYILDALNAGKHVVTANKDLIAAHGKELLDAADGVEAYVCPMLIPSSHPLASVNDSYNAVFVNGDAVENAMFYGRGAGEFPTASAVVGDLFEIVRNIQANCCARIGCTCYKELPVKKMADTCNRYFMRLIVEDRCGVLAEMTAVFAKYGVSVAQIIQKAARDEGSAEVVVITAKVREGDFRTAMEELSGRSSVRKISSMLRVYGE